MLNLIDLRVLNVLKNWIENILLEGKKVKLILLVKSHRDEFVQAGSDGQLWELWLTSVPSDVNIVVNFFG